MSQQTLIHKPPEFFEVFRLKINVYVSYEAFAMSRSGNGIQLYTAVSIVTGASDYQVSNKAQSSLGALLALCELLVDGMVHLLQQWCVYRGCGHSTRHC